MCSRITTNDVNGHFIDFVNINVFHRHCPGTGNNLQCQATTTKHQICSFFSGYHWVGFHNDHNDSFSCGLFGDLETLQMIYTTITPNKAHPKQVQLGIVPPCTEDSSFNLCHLAQTYTLNPENTLLYRGSLFPALTIEGQGSLMGL